MPTPIEAKPTVAQEESTKESEKATDQTQNQNQNPDPFDMRICITGGTGGLFGAATARIAGALAPKAQPPKADIF